MNPSAVIAEAARPRTFGAAISGRRSEQQDAFRSVWLADEQAWLLLVADGMGGHAGGAIASRIAADAFVSAFTSQRAAGVSLDSAFQGALVAANREIAAIQGRDPATQGMGTTLLAVHLDARGVAWISVGDSPLWLCRGGLIRRLNEDHSLSRSDAAGTRIRSSLLQSVLNGDDIAMIDCQANPLRLDGGDLVLLASDGILTLGQEEILQTVIEHEIANPETVVREILEAVCAREKPNQDNCTIVAAAVPVRIDGERPEMRPRYRLLGTLVAVCLIVAVVAELGWKWFG